MDDERVAEHERVMSLYDLPSRLLGWSTGTSHWSTDVDVTAYAARDGNLRPLSARRFAGDRPRRQQEYP